MSTNNNYAPVARGFKAANDYYVSPDVGAFNAVHASGSFAAYVTLLLSGSIQTAAYGALQAMHLWGNRDSVGATGWSLNTTIGAGPDIQFSALMNAVAFNFVLTTPLNPTPIERLVMLGLWYDATNLWLTVNGVVVGNVASAALSPSAVAARIGSSPTDPLLPATFAEIVSVGYSDEFDLASSDGVIGTLAASAFDAARADFGSGYLSANSGWDWTHRYDFRGATGGTIVKTAQGARVLAYPDAPATLIDRGGQGSANPNLVTNVPVDLTRVTAGANGLFVNTRKNPDWVSLGTYIEAV